MPSQLDFTPLPPPDARGVGTGCAAVLGLLAPPPLLLRETLALLSTLPPVQDVSKLFSSLRAEQNVTISRI